VTALAQVTPTAPYGEQFIYTNVLIGSGGYALGVANGGGAGAWRLAGHADAPRACSGCRRLRGRPGLTAGCRSTPRPRPAPAAGQAVSGTANVPAGRSNHNAGHAIDALLRYYDTDDPPGCDPVAGACTPKICQVDRLKNPPADSIKGFQACLRDDAKLRRCGDVKDASGQPDYPHFDDGLNVTCADDEAACKAHGDCAGGEAFCPQQSKDRRQKTGAPVSCSSCQTCNAQTGDCEPVLGPDGKPTNPCGDRCCLSDWICCSGDCVPPDRLLTDPGNCRSRGKTCDNEHGEQCLSGKCVCTAPASGCGAG